MMYAKPRLYSYMSRYTIYRLIVDDNEAYDETVNVTPIPESDNDKYHEVLLEEENRLDIIAYKYYNDASFSWIIAMANNIIDPFFIKRGTVLRIPDFSSLFQYDSVLYKRV